MLDSNIDLNMWLDGDRCDLFYDLQMIVDNNSCDTTVIATKQRIIK